MLVLQVGHVGGLLLGVGLCWLLLDVLFLRWFFHGLVRLLWRCLCLSGRFSYWCYWWLFLRLLDFGRRARLWLSLLLAWLLLGGWLDRPSRGFRRK